MSAAEARRKRGLQLLHLKLNALRKLQAESEAQVRAAHATGAVTAEELALLEEECHQLVRTLAARRWDLQTPEPITMANLMVELGLSYTSEGV